MPLYYFRCGPCNSQIKVFCKPEKLQDERKCKTCGSNLVRNQQSPTTNVMEILDNGLMARAVERIADAEEVFKERARKDTLERAGLVDD
jgi:putative FmdB family regulatory protein